MRHYIGIDPGGRGYISVLTQDGECVSTLAIEDSTGQQIADFLSAEIDGNPIAVMEDVHAMPGQGVSSTFTFGRNVGFLVGLLVAFKIPYVLVTPQRWQKAVWIAADHVTVTANGKKRVMPKPTSINAATRLFPSVDLRKNPKCRAVHDGKCDSLLIAVYAKRMNL